MRDDKDIKPEVFIIDKHDQLRGLWPYVKRLENHGKAKVILSWDDRHLYCKTAKDRAEIIAYQHGRRGIIRSYEEKNPCIADQWLVWGENDAKEAESFGVPKEIIKVVGTPIFNELIMKVFLRNHNHVLDEIEKHFEKVDTVSEADRIVLWQEVLGEERSVVKWANYLHKPVITVQHGRRGSSQYFSPFNKKILSDVLCVWGKRDMERLVKAGNPPEKIEITGTTVFGYLQPRKKHEKTTIVFCPEHWDKELKENKEVADELRRLAKKHDWRIITKIIENHNPDLYDNPVFSRRDDPDHLDKCAEVLAEADLVVGLSESTFELMAQVLDIPVVVSETWYPKSFLGDTKYMGYERVYSEACKTAEKVSRLEEIILDQLENPDELKEERKRVALLEGGYGLPFDPAEKIIEIIKNAHRR